MNSLVLCQEVSVAHQATDAGIATVHYTSALKYCNLNPIQCAQMPTYVHGNFEIQQEKKRKELKHVSDIDVCCSVHAEETKPFKWLPL